MILSVRAERIPRSSKGLWVFEINSLPKCMLGVNNVAS